MDSNVNDNILLEMKENCLCFGTWQQRNHSSTRLQLQNCTMYAIFLHARNNKTYACHAENVRNHCNSISSWQWGDSVYPAIIPCINRIKVYPINQIYIQSLPQYDLVHLSYVEIRCEAIFLAWWFCFFYIYFRIISLWPDRCACRNWRALPVGVFFSQSLTFIVQIQTYIYIDQT